MLLGFKTELKLNNKQRTALAKHAGVSRHAWNWGLGLTKLILDHNQDTREDKIKFPTAIDLHKWLVALVKPICPWYYEVSKCAPQFALRQLAQAWKDAFKKNKKPPRFKRKGKHDSFTLDGSIELDHFKIKVPKIGWLKTYERLPVRRPGRSCQDAIEAIFTAINRKPKWVLDADIAKCFDKIDHKQLLTKLNTS